MNPVERYGISIPTVNESGQRSDAARNRQRVLAAAAESFAQSGPDVQLSEIAGRARVGVGTVYRHFPTKEALFSAVLTERISAFVRAARGLVDLGEPGDSFFCFLFNAITSATLNAALCAELEDRICHATDEHATARTEYRELLAVLLVRAQRAGVVRADVDPADVSALITGCVTAARQRNATDRSQHLVTLACTGLLADPTTGLPDWSRVTKLLAETAPDRHETSHETRCAQCGRPIEAARTGRPARFCGPTCRQRAHRTVATSRARPAAPGSGTRSPAD